MLIKRVTIQGFKSFAKRTEFVFDPGVTAIVGPNGSGKSNIVDAIRWCLGEQSFSLLRSKKTSDVIFSGSDAKARLSMAQVTLLLDNSAGELDLDFDEIEITRRAYRDGNNEYLLNGKRVRLQDITHLLAETGLGRRTYALIGQGLIDRILSLAPEELRSLFEEAAGITGYQAKRTATVRRLDAAHQNLTRVQDIVAELSPRLGYLKRQAERALQREEIAEALRSLLREWYGYHWHVTLKNLDQHHRTVDQLQSKVESHQKALETIAHKIEGNRANQSELRGTLGELHRTGSKLHQEAEQVGRNLAVNQERLRQIRSRQEEIERELSPLRIQAERADEQIVDIQAQVEAAQVEMTTQLSRVEKLEQTLAAQEADRTSLARAVEDARQRLEQARRERTEAATRREQLSQQEHTLLSEKEEQTQAGRVAEAEATEAATQLTEQTRILSEVDSAISVRKEERQTHRDQHEALREELATLSQQRQDADRVLDRLQTRCDLLTRLQREGAGYASGVRAVIQAANNGAQIKGILGTVASLLRVPADLDKALEVALGGAYQNIVTQRWQDTQAAIDYLNKSQNGRATFLPLDRLSVMNPIPAPDLPGVLGNAIDLVEFDPHLSDVAHQLLNRVWIVETLDAARYALDRHQHRSRPTVVTMDGEIVRPGGAVTGGRDRTRRDDSILARERELRALPTQITQAQSSLRQIEGRIESTENQLAENQAKLTLFDTNLAAMDERRIELRAQVEEHTRWADRAQHTRRWRMERLAEIDGEMNTLSKRSKELDQQADALASRQLEAEESLKTAVAAHDAARPDQLLHQLADQRTLGAERQAAWRQHKTRLDEQRTALATVRDQIQSKEATLRSLRTEISELSEQIRQQAEREHKLSEQTRTMQAKIEPDETRLAALDRAQTALEHEERQLQDVLRRDESAWRNAELQYQRTEDHLNSLRREIENDLGLVLLEIGDDLAYQPPLPWDTLVEQLKPHDEVSEGLEEEVQTLRGRLNRVRNVNPDAPREYAEAAQRHDHLLTQSDDLQAAIDDMRKIVRELDDVMQAELNTTFAAVSEVFVGYFESLFNGGAAKLILLDPEDIANSGIEIIARPPGKRPQSLALLSGGERTLTACALIFAILHVSPTPFCILDEVDAALDEANVDRFRLTVEELSKDTQFILITHNRRTLEGTNAIYGITMSSDGTSRVISLQLDGDTISRRENGGSGPEGDAAAIEELVEL